jgi:putative transposase
MQMNALRARPRRRQFPKDQGERSITALNMLERKFDATIPNQKLGADFTDFWTAEGWLYVAVVIDRFSRRGVGWSPLGSMLGMRLPAQWMKDTMIAQMVTDALMMAIWRRGWPKELIHHSDQGRQYTSEPFQRLVTNHGVTCSMSRSGNVWEFKLLHASAFKRSGGSFEDAVRKSGKLLHIAQDRAREA